MNKAILKKEVQEYIRQNLNSDLSKLILQGSPFHDVTVQEIATQVQGLQKAKTKFPSWFSAENIIFPPNLNLEQTSSEITARYKASLVSGKNAIDLTGGFGIDSFFLADNFEKLIHCEFNAELSEIAAHNFTVLGKENIHTITGNGIEYLNSASIILDLIYIDPSRRDDYGGKIFLLEQCTPNVPENLNYFFEKAENIMIKTSPLLDLSAGINSLRKVAEIHIVSVGNEVKEVLWLLKKSATEVEIKTVNILKDSVQKFNTRFPESSETAELTLPKKYLFEPNPAVMKSGMFSEVSKQTKTAKLHPNSHLYTSDELKEFPGRSFLIKEIFPYSKKSLKKNLNLNKANITTRNFPKTVETLRKELKLAEGGDVYLFFTTNLSNEKTVLLCEKVNFENS